MDIDLEKMLLCDLCDLCNKIEKVILIYEGCCKCEVLVVVESVVCEFGFSLVELVIVKLGCSKVVVKYVNLEDFDVIWIGCGCKLCWV